MLNLVLQGQLLTTKCQEDIQYSCANYSKYSPTRTLHLPLKYLMVASVRDQMLDWQDLVSASAWQSL